MLLLDSHLLERDHAFPIHDVQEQVVPLTLSLGNDLVLCRLCGILPAIF